jgi:large subunit ribosomal protein L21
LRGRWRWVRRATTRVKGSMKAVILVAGKQYIVGEKEQILVDLLPAETKSLTIEPLMLIDGKNSKVGAPTVKNSEVKAKVIESEVKGEKTRAIRYHAKKRVHTERGHRQKYTRLEIVSIK